jgi:chromosome segregation ATPase
MFDSFTKRIRSLAKSIFLTHTSSSQAELRTLKSTFDKISHERKNLSAELSDSKEYCYKLEIQISRMENSSQLLLEADHLKAEVNRLQQLLEQKQIDVEIFEQKRQQLEQEKSSLAHSLEACLSYQQVCSLSLSLSVSGPISDSQ